MKAICTRFIFATIVLIIAAGICHAQSLLLKPAPARVTIDGNTAEWGYNLPYNNDKAKISYNLANDKNNLYLVIKTKDTVLQSDILGSGITFSIGKKNITFPINELDNETRYLNLTPEQTEIKSALTKYRKIGIDGFKTIDENQISTLNPYGIQIAISYNANGYLTYEEAIPLALFDTEGEANGEWPFTIKINALEKKETIVLLAAAKGDDGNGIDQAVLTRQAANVKYQIQAVYGDDLNKWIKIMMNNPDSMKTNVNLTPSVEFEGKLMLSPAL